jgi:hypothetical protein
VPARPEFLSRAEAWIASLPDLDPVALADVFHTEQVKGCWGGVIEYGELGLSSARLCPMTRRDLIDQAFRLPLEYRLKKQLHHDVIARHWPELLDVPFDTEYPVPPARDRFFDYRGRIRQWIETWAGAIRRRRARREAGTRVMTSR